MDDESLPSKKQNEVVDKINKVLPKIPDMNWGALTNIYPTNAKLEEMNRLLPHDKKWHLLYEEKDQSLHQTVGEILTMVMPHLSMLMLLTA